MRAPAALLLAVLAASCARSPDGPLPDAGAAPDAAPAADPCAASDGDGDGFGTDPSCTERDCDDRNVNVRPGAAEACNGADDDCDQEVDEDLGSGFCGLGACRREAPNCSAGRPAACLPGPPGAELCNGLDDDCDGQVDEDAAGASCGVGACARQATCTQGQQGTCTPGQPSAEQCNRADDDCDGVVDNGFRVAVVNGSYAALYGLHPGCDGAGERAGPSCNAAIHRFCGGQGCSTAGLGPLENSGDLAVLACVVAPARVVPYSELAQRHDVCDGTRERIGPSCNAAIHRYCGGQGLATGFGPVEATAGEASVVCLDGALASVLQAQYSTLVTIHPGCNDTARIGPDCNAAIHRRCAALGYTTGFGPVENAGDDLTIVCLRD